MKPECSVDTVRKLIRTGVSKEKIMEITGCSERTSEHEKRLREENLFLTGEDEKKKKPRYIRTVSGLMYLR